ncbi:MAG: hypothetical protein ACP5D4_16055 [Baaleninema sp.]
MESNSPRRERIRETPRFGVAVSDSLAWARIKPEMRGLAKSKKP